MSNSYFVLLMQHVDLFDRKALTYSHILKSDRGSPIYESEENCSCIPLQSQMAYNLEITIDYINNAKSIIKKCKQDRVTESKFHFPLLHLRWDGGISVRNIPAFCLHHFRGMTPLVFPLDRPYATAAPQDALLTFVISTPK